MKKLLISLTLVLFTSVIVFSQKLTFESDRYIVTEDETEIPVEENSVITIENGVIVLNPQKAESNDHVNLLLNGMLEKVNKNDVITTFYNCVDKNCNEVVISVSVFLYEDFVVIGFITGNIDVYYRGNFKKEERGGFSL